ncbi:MAG: Gfo/Idh/MocA family oxidoreductase [Bryobacteraceae bacterium]
MALAGTLLARRDFLSGLAALRLPRKIRIGMIGLDGHTGEVLAPLPHIPDAEVVALYDPAPATVARFLKSPACKNAKAHTDYRKMLDTEKLDVVGICNENSGHAPAILECLGRGIHVISEKPIATELADMPKLRKAVAAGPAKFTAMLPMRFDSPYLGLKQLVDSGELGEVFQIDGQKSYKPSARPPWYFKRQTYGGTMPWIGIHMIDLMLFTSGRNFTEAAGFQNHIGFPETGDTENVTATVFRLDNGGVALLRMDYLRPKAADSHGDDRLRLAGSKGIAEYMGATGVTVMSDRRGRTVITDLPARRSLFTEFLDHIYNGKPAPIAWKEIERGHEIVLVARDAMEAHRIQKI